MWSHRISQNMNNNILPYTSWHDFSKNFRVILFWAMRWLHTFILKFPILLPIQVLWILNCTIYLKIATSKRLSPYCVNSYLLHITYSRDSIDKCTSVYLWSWVNCIFLSFPSSFFAGSVIHHLYWTLSGDVIVSPSLPYLGCLQQKPTYLAYRALVAAVGSLKWRTTHAPKPNAPQPEHDVEVGRGVLKPKKEKRKKKKWKRYDIVVRLLYIEDFPIVIWRFFSSKMTAISGATVGAGSAACSACNGKMLKLLFTLVVLTSLLTPQPVISIQVLPDGGYSGIVIKISQDVPQENCADILQKIQVSYNIYTRWTGYSSYTKGQIISKGLLVSSNSP